MTIELTLRKNSEITEIKNLVSKFVNDTTTNNFWVRTLGQKLTQEHRYLQNNIGKLAISILYYLSIQETDMRNELIVKDCKLILKEVHKKDKDFLFRNISMDYEKDIEE